ncbi:thioesterase II family protein [Actinoplanes xinjiangensis]|uniref:thioesterase II family protein n=1 Tax=Actinoplanes xinjiangensis TaxID=512350 RepID=UPI00342A115E
MTAAVPRWVLARPRRTPAVTRMYCFPHSGGSPGEYLRWGARLRDHDVRAVQLPGRGSRLSEEPFTRMADLVRALIGNVGFAAPYVLFGHSLGALVAYETARELRDRGLPGPEALVLSGTAAPHALPYRPLMSDLDGPELLAEIERLYGPVPAPLHEDPELSTLLLTGLRADLAIVSGYRPVPAEPLDCPITVLGGRDDDEPHDGLRAWRSYTTGAFDLRLFPGDHFYFREHPDAFFDHLGTVLTRSAAPAVPRQRSMGAAAPVSRAVTG